MHNTVPNENAGLSKHMLYPRQRLLAWKLPLFGKVEIGGRALVVYLLEYVDGFCYIYRILTTLNSEFQNICEGRKDVDARIDAPGLITLSLDTILPKIQAFATGFPWRQDQFVT